MSFAIFRKRIIIVFTSLFSKGTIKMREKYVIKITCFSVFYLAIESRDVRPEKNTFVFRWRVKILVFSPVRAHRSHWSANNCETRSNGTVIRRSFLFRENKMKSVSIKRRDKFSDISRLAPFPLKKKYLFLVHNYIFLYMRKHFYIISQNIHIIIFIFIFHYEK